MTLLLITLSCGLPQKSNYPNVAGSIKDTTSQKIASNRDSLYTEEESRRINLSEFRRYQTFDEFKMKGVGNPVYEPFVYVQSEKERIRVIVSNDTANVITYHLRDGLWYMHIDLDLWKKNRDIAKSSKENWARSYDRICGNDTIVELGWYYLGDFTSKCFWLKTRKECIRSQSLSTKYFTNKDSIYESLRKFTSEFLKDENGLKNKRNQTLKYKRYSFYENQGAYWYFGEKDSLCFKKSSLGFFGIQPGFDKFDRELSSRDYFP